MSYTPPAASADAVPFPVVHNLGRYGLAIEKAGFPSSGIASAVWTTTRRVIYTPINMPSAFTAEGFMWWNGTAVSGNVDCGLFSSVDGLPADKLASTGSTAQSGTSSWQFTAAASPVALPAGQYFLALMLDNTTGRIFRWAITTFGSYLRLTGACMETMGAGSTLPSTATPATFGSTNALPIFGMYTVPGL